MDYMKGYQNRNRRRREARNRRKMGGRKLKKKVSGYVEPVIYSGGGYNERKEPEGKAKSSSSYRQLSKWQGDSGKPGIRMGRKIMAGAAALVTLSVVLLLIFLNPFGGLGSSGETEASGSSVSQAAENSAETEKAGVAKQVAAVPYLSPDAIAVPTPKPRSKAVALTFDDGPSQENTPKVLAHLKKYNANATFFVVGSRVSAGAEVLKSAVKQGCEIANHSWSHANLSRMKMKGINKEYDKTRNLVKKLTGYNITLLRPPYGAISDRMRKKLKHPMILWSVDTLDWKSRNAKAVYKQVKKTVSDGDIILMHDIHSTTADSLPKVLSWLVKNDYDILSVSELMERKGVKMKNGIAYGGIH